MTIKSKRPSKNRGMDLSHKYKGPGNWLIIRIREGCELSENYKSIENDLQNVLEDNTEYFIPAYVEKVEDQFIPIVLFEGYVFAKCSDCICDLSNVSSLDGPLIINHSIQYAKNRDINNFKDQLNSQIQRMIPKKGQLIVPKIGTFKNLEGTVISVNRKRRTAKAIFNMASRVVSAYINVINLEILD